MVRPHVKSVTKRWLELNGEVKTETMIDNCNSVEKDKTLRPDYVSLKVELI